MALRALIVLLAARGALGVEGMEGPCGPEVEDACKGKTGPEMAQCLKDRQGLNTHCYEWITMHDACFHEFNMGFCATGCDGETCAYTDDAYECLTEWAPADEMGEHCRLFLPRPGVMHPDADAEEL